MEVIKSSPIISSSIIWDSWMVDIDNGRGSLQVNNFHQGSFEKFENINANKIIELNKVRGGIMGHGCMPGCAMQCSSIFHDADGQYVTASLEYETLSMLGANLGIDDLDAIARMDRKCDGLGIDTIETGCTIGILNDIGLFEFGDVAKAEAFIEEIGKGSPMEEFSVVEWRSQPRSSVWIGSLQ